MSGDSYCAQQNPGHPTFENFVVDNGGLENVFVYIKDGLGNKYIFDTPVEPVKIDQSGCHYVPHVLGLRTTQPLEIVNSDNTMHNVHGMPQTNREFNFGQPVPGMKNTVTFTGHCRQVTVSGQRNHVTIDAADAISTDGIGNVVTYHTGTPTIDTGYGPYAVSATVAARPVPTNPAAIRRVSRPSAYRKPTWCTASQTSATFRYAMSESPRRGALAELP